jgi:hypothetical protein
MGVWSMTYRLYSIVTEKTWGIASLRQTTGFTPGYMAERACREKHNKSHSLRRWSVKICSSVKFCGFVLKSYIEGTTYFKSNWTFFVQAHTAFQDKTYLRSTFQCQWVAWAAEFRGVVTVGSYSVFWLRVLEKHCQVPKFKKPKAHKAISFFSVLVAHFWVTLPSTKVFLRPNSQKVWVELELSISLRC